MNTLPGQSWAGLTPVEPQVYLTILTAGWKKQLLLTLPNLQGAQLMRDSANKVVVLCLVSQVSDVTEWRWKDATYRLVQCGHRSHTK